MILNSAQIAFFVLCVVFGSAVLGMLISRRLPAHHMSPEAKATVSVAMAVVGTMTALVIGFLISNANSAFNARNATVSLLSSNISQLDTLLRRYGPETAPIRDSLQRFTAMKFDDLFVDKADGKHTVDNPTTARMFDNVEDRILALKPVDDRQRWLSGEALRLATGVRAARSLVVQQNVNSLPLPFVGVVVLWLIVVYGSFGLFAPRNATTIVALFFSVLAVAMAFKLVLDLDNPFDRGIRLTPPPIRISGEPLRHVLDVIRQ
ncbi:MAG: hypothetical protein PSV46_10445 [Reyranella sp.]|nr:hypothetical protein [Reyranella sp.]